MGVTDGAEEVGLSNTYLLPVHQAKLAYVAAGRGSNESVQSKVAWKQL